MKKIKVAAAVSAACFITAALSGCGNVKVEITKNGPVAASCENSRLYLNELNFLFMNWQTKYNKYYSDMGDMDFWKETSDGKDFSTILKNGRFKEEIEVLLMLNAMAKDYGVSLSDEEQQLCSQAAEEYYNGLSSLEKQYVQGSSEDAAGLYRLYLTAKKTQDSICSGLNEEISDNDKRVITLQIIADNDKAAIEKALDDIKDGKGFETAAAEYSSLSQTEYQVSRGTLNPVLEEKAFYMSSGDVSDIIETEKSYYIIKCVDDFNKELSDANEENILSGLKYDIWSEELNEYSQKHSIAIAKEIWDGLEFTATTALQSDNLFDVYNKYF